MSRQTGDMAVMPVPDSAKTAEFDGMSIAVGKRPELIWQQALLDAHRDAQNIRNGVYPKIELVSGRYHELQVALSSGHDIVRHAKALGERHVALPWDAKHVPAVHDMYAQLAKSADWELVYTNQKAITDYCLKPGDLALWDKTILSPYSDGTTVHLNLQHSRIIGDDGEILYAG